MKAQMSFMSRSGTQKACREFIFANGNSPDAREIVKLKSDRFTRKALYRHNTGSDAEVMMAHYRAPDDMCGDVASLQDTSYGEIEDLTKFPYQFTCDEDVFAWLCGLASESPSCRAMLREAQEAGWNIGLADTNGEGFILESDEGLIVLDHFGFTADALGRASHIRNNLFLNFIKALRRLWHVSSGNDFDSTHRPDALLMIERACNADLETMCILVGWELRAAGHTDLWRTVLGSEQGDMAMIFTRAIEKDPAGFYDGSVLARTFCQWYAEENRIAESDHRMLERMDGWLDEDTAAAEIFGSRPLRAKDIESLSQLPAGGAYLCGMGSNICTDPYFIAINDTINESHLFQIVYDSRVVMVGGVPFRDEKLARLIFPKMLETSK